jgi:hypothetical protein
MHVIPETKIVEICLAWGVGVHMEAGSEFV